jgi:hypothetical protein
MTIGSTNLNPHVYPNSGLTLPTSPTTTGTAGASVVTTPLGITNPNLVGGTGFGSMPALSGDSFGGAPPLMNLHTSATSADVMGACDLFSSGPGASEGSLMYLALSTMSKTAEEERQVHADVKQAAQGMKINAKDGEIAAKVTKMNADIKDAQDSYATALTCFVITCVAAAVSVVGSSMSSSGKAASSVTTDAGAKDLGYTDVAAANSAGKSLSGWGGGISAVGTGVGATSSLYSAYQNKESWERGAKRQGAEADIEQTRWQKMQEVFEQNVDEAKSSIESSKEQFKLAQRVMKETEERRSQNVSAFTRA